MISAQRSPVRSSSDAIVFRSTSVMRLIDRMELPSTSAEITASFFSLESVYISAPQFPLDGRLRQADNLELRGHDSGLPGCGFRAASVLQHLAALFICACHWWRGHCSPFPCRCLSKRPANLVHLPS